MTARSALASLLAAVALACGTGIIAAPTAAAKPNASCGRYIQSVRAWNDQYHYSADNYGLNDSRTWYALDQYSQAEDRAAAAGCGTG
jgi:hypothetical protein